MREIDVSIMGVTGIVGNKFLEILSQHPYFHVNNVYASEQSAGKSIASLLKIEDYGLKEEILEKRVLPLDDRVLKDESDIIFSSLPTEVAINYESKLAAQGKKVITNSSAFRMDKNTPIIVPEVNYSHLGLVRGKKGFIIANGNCSTIGLVLSLAPIREHIEEVVVTTQQSVSGAGYPGVPSWDMIGNIVPYIDKEEGKLENETRKILGIFNGEGIEFSDISIFPTALRVPTRESHMGSVTLLLKDGLTMEDIEYAYENFRFEGKREMLYLMPEKPIILRYENNRPQPVLDYLAGKGIVRGMPVVVGRFRLAGNRLSYVFLVNNLVRGAAGSSILNGEIAVQEGLI